MADARGAAGPDGAAEQALDAALVARVTAGDADAYGLLVRRHLPAAYAIARAVVAEPADAEDVCQDALLAALERIERCQPPEMFRAWLLRSVRNRAISFRRWQRVRVAAVLGTAPGETDLPARTESPLAAAERAELRAGLAGALARLPEAQRTVMLLHDVEGWTHREIGTHLGVAEGTSRATLFAARRRLRAHLGRSFATDARPAASRLAS